MTRRRNPSRHKRQRRASRQKAFRNAQDAAPQPPDITGMDECAPVIGYAPLTPQPFPWPRQAPPPPDNTGDSLPEPAELDWFGEDKFVTFTAVVMSVVWLAIIAGILIPLIQ